MWSISHPWFQLTVALRLCGATNLSANSLFLRHLRNACTYQIKVIVDLLYRSIQSLVCFENLISNGSLKCPII